MAVEVSNLRSLPGLAQRPDFPRGLSVLLVDADFRARTEAEAQLRENHYNVTPCSCSAEAAAFLSNPENSCDVLLADVRCLQQKTAETTAVVHAAKSIPLILMSESGAPNEVMLGIKLGAVDFLEKPLSPLKLKNIWQHMVRRLLLASPNAPSQLKKSAALAASGTASPEDSGSHGHAGPRSHTGPGTHSHGSGGESGSNASTSDQAPVKMECDADMETSSFQDAMGCMDELTAGLARVGNTNAPASAGPGPAGTPGSDATPHAAAAAAAAAAMPCGGGGGSSGGGLRSPRPLASKYRASRSSMPGNNASAGAGSSSHSLAPKPCIGYPAGQMPALPAGVPGIEWGLPTNPLQISPKAAPMGGGMGMGMGMGMNMGMGGGMMGPMGWPSSPFMAPPLFHPMMMGGGGGSQTSMAAMGGGSMPLSSSCVALSSCCANNNNMNSSSNHCNSGAQGGLSLSMMKRADSAPLPALSSISTASAVTTASGLGGGGGAAGGACDGLMMPPPAARVPGGNAAGGGAAGGGGGGSLYGKPDFVAGLEETGKSLRPPLGLQLKKSASLLDFISHSLKHGDGSPAC